MSDFGEFFLRYKRSDSADLVTNSFSDIFDKYQFISNQLESFDIEMDAGDTYTLTAPAASSVLFAFFVLRDVWPVQVGVSWVTVGGNGGVALVKGLNNENLPKPESQTGSFAVLPQIQPGSNIVLASGTSPVTKATFYWVTT